jgi:hypothetical protein
MRARRPVGLVRKSRIKSNSPSHRQPQSLVGRAHHLRSNVLSSTVLSLTPAPATIFWRPVEARVAGNVEAAAPSTGQIRVGGVEGQSQRGQADLALAPVLPSIIPSMSDSLRMSRSPPSISTSVAAHFPHSTRSPTLTSSGIILPVSSRAPGSMARTSPSLGFSFAVSGMMIPAGVFSSDSINKVLRRDDE